MENEKNRNYLDERRSSGENNPPSLDPENEIKSGPKKELLGSSDDIKEPENENNEILEMMKKKKNKDLTTPIILGVVFLMIIAIVAGFYFLKDKDIPTIGGVGPQQKILNSSMVAMSNVESYSFEGDFNFDSNDLTGRNSKQGLSLAIEFDGQVDQSDQDNIKSSFNIRPKIDIFDKTYEEDMGVLHFDFTSDAFCAGCKASYLDLSMKSFGKVGEETIYLKLNDLGLGTSNSIADLITAPYKNKWYFLDMKELREESGFPLEENDFDFKKMIEEIKDLSKKYEMIKFQKDLGDTKLGDTDAYHYQVKIDSEAVMDFYIELFKMSPFLADGLSKDELENLEAEIEENREEILAVASEVLGNIKTEVWIGKNDKMIYKMAMSGEFDEAFMERLEEKMKEIKKEKRPDPETIDYNEFEEKDINMYEGLVPEPPYSEEPEEKKVKPELSFSMNMIMSDFNQPINISKPEEAEDLMKALEEMVMGMMGGMMAPGVPGVGLGDDSDQDGLSDEMETFYGTDPNNPDTDGDGHSDGNEVSRGYDPLLPGEAKLDYDRLFSK